MTCSKAKLRVRRGGVPPDGWLICVIRFGDAWWALFERGMEGRFLRLKVCAERVQGKANYWISWDAKNECFTGVPDYKALAEQHPVVCEAVRELLASLSIPPQRDKRSVMAFDWDSGYATGVPRFPTPGYLPVQALKLKDRVLFPVGYSAEGTGYSPGACEAPPISVGAIPYPLLRKGVRATEIGATSAHDSERDSEALDDVSDLI